MTSKEVSDFPHPVRKLCHRDWKPDLGDPRAQALSVKQQPKGTAIVESSGMGVHSFIYKQASHPRTSLDYSFYKVEPGVGNASPLGIIPLG